MPGETSAAIGPSRSPDQRVSVPRVSADSGSGGSRRGVWSWPPPSAVGLPRTSPPPTCPITGTVGIGSVKPTARAWHGVTAPRQKLLPHRPRGGSVSSPKGWGGGRWSPSTESRISAAADPDTPATSDPGRSGSCLRTSGLSGGHSPPSSPASQGSSGFDPIPAHGTQP